MPKESVTLQFILHNFKSEDDEKAEPAIVYQCRHLEEKWKLKDIVSAHRKFSEPWTWWVSIKVVEFSEVQWMWVLATHDKKIKRSESLDFRRTEVRYIGGDIHSTWGIKEVLCEQRGCYVNLETCYQTKQGECLAVVGSGTALGDWAARDAIQAELESEANWKWRVRLWVDHYSSREWKWVVIDSRRCLVRWEDCANRRLTCIDNKAQTIYTPWNHPEDDVVTFEENGDLPSRLRFRGKLGLQLENSDRLFEPEDIVDRLGKETG